MSRFDREEQAAAAERDDRRGPSMPGPDPAKFWSEVSRREAVMATVLCTEGAECDLDFICKAHQLALDGPDEPEEKRSGCIECGRPSIEQCDDCGLPVCNWSVSASIQGPEESCWQQHIAGHVAEENEAYVAEMEGGTL